MIYFLKHFKGVAYLLAMIILFQSCVVYYPSSVAEASQYNNRLIKIKTFDKEKYKLKWIEEKDDNLVSIKNVKREYLNRDQILQIVKYDPEPSVISNESLFYDPGPVQILKKDKKGRYNSDKFIKISENENTITGYKMIRKDTLTVVIPIDQIEKIELQNKGASAALTAIAFLGITTVVVGAIAFIASGGFNIDMGITTQ